MTAQLGTYTQVGSGGAQTYGNDLRPISWTDGTPLTSSTSNTNGLFIAGGPRLFVHRASRHHHANFDCACGWVGKRRNPDGAVVGRMAAPYTDLTTNVNGQYDRNYTLTYAAASAGQTLTVSWVVNSGYGNVTLNAAALQ